MFFGLEMKNYRGDLADIIRASSTTGGREVSDEIAATVASVSDPDFWPSDPITDQAVRPSSTPFGDPFSNMQDPLFLDLQLNNIPAGSSFFITSPSSSVDHHHVINTSTTTTTSSTVDDNTSTSTIEVANDNHHRQKGFDHVEMMKSPCNIFSRIQISQPCDSPHVVASSAMINANSSRDCLIENSVKPVQISSPRNLGIKRRKSQAKVVCIPAPEAPNSRQSGEVVPSDLWAWRKYGQKPIKGSPYPRGYYRCSGSKGCSARKQVERSRTDPNMLVITYTSEHNHPWPTQKNSLAGSTRSQPPKTNTSTISRLAQAKEDKQKESSSNDNSAFLSSIMPSTSTSVNEENIEDFDTNLENIDDVERFRDGFQSYRSSLLPPDSSSDQDFFADLGELEADPPSLLFTIKGKESKCMDPFTLFDWSSGDTTNTQFDNK